MSNTNRAVASASAVLLLSAVFAGCSSEPTVATLELTGNDKMKFSVERFETDAPAKLTIRFKNVGTLPKVAMGHNLVLLKRGEKPITFAADCVSGGANADNEYLPESLRGRAIAWTRVLGPGEEDTITAELSEPGTYAYVCTFPGHAAMMKGEVVAR
ncbi:MAG: azurin [Planctomycetes bacterium]|nr:azurin [Planctomycetota bacterium]